MPSSLELIHRYVETGVLSKEAAAEAVAVRKALIKEAIGKGFKDLFRRAAKESASAPVEKPGWFERLSKPKLYPDKGQEREWGDVTSNLAKMLGLAGLTAGAATGLNVGARKLTEARQQRQIEDSYNQIYDEEPGLHTADPEKVRRTFSLIARYAPSAAADPMVAASMVHAYMQRPAGDIQKDVKTLSELETQIRHSRDVPPVVKPEKALGWAASGMGFSDSGS